MQVETKYQIGDQVWDTLTKQKTTVVGLRIEIGHQCCQSGYKDEVLYVVENHLCHSYRKEDELISTQ